MLGIPFYGYGWTAAITGIIVLVILWFVLGYKRKQEVVTGVDESTGIAKKKMQLLPLISARVKNTALLCMLMLMSKPVRSVKSIPGSLLLKRRSCLTIFLKFKTTMLRVNII